MKQPKKAPILKSFGYAFEGIFAGIKKERNMKIHCTMMVLVVAAGLFFQISSVKWCLCFILFGLVMALELVNTAVEAVVDLIAAMMAAAAGCVIFIPELLEWMHL